MDRSANSILWRNMSKHLIVKAIENLGWKYVPGKGRKGSRFERLRNESDTDMAADICGDAGEPVEYKRHSWTIAVRMLATGGPGSSPPRPITSSGRWSW